MLPVEPKDKIQHGTEKEDYTFANLCIGSGQLWHLKALGPQAEECCDKLKNRRDGK